MFIAHDLLTYATAFFVTIFFISLLSPIAQDLNLVDEPGGRKKHKGNVPLIGGIAMFLGFSMAVLTLNISLFNYRPFLAASTILVVVGVLDDLHELTPRLRLVSQVIAALLMTAWGGNIVHNLGNIVYLENVDLQLWALPFTVVATVGIINAVNMTDGIDGLAGSQALIEIILLTILAFHTREYTDVKILLILVCVLLAFLCFNFPFPFRKQAKVFMGDAGSMFLGFTLAWFLVSLSQGEHPAARPVTMLWILAVPLFDTTRLLINRLLTGRLPSEPDRNHLHHILILKGIRSSTVTILICGISLMFGLAGIAGGYYAVPEGVMFNIYLILFAVYFLLL